MKLFKLTTLFTAVSSIYAQVCPSGSPFCVDIKITGNEAKFTIEGPSEAGYMAIGVGTSMSDSEMFISYMNAKNEPKVIHSLGAGRTQPKLQTNNYTVVKSDSKILSNKKIISFTRLLKSNLQQGGKDLNLGTNNFIWAYSTQVPTDEGVIRKHSAKGAFNYELNAQSATNPTSTPTTPPPSGPAKVIIIHGALMLVAWILLPIIAIYIARFLKGALGVWWFRLHFGLFILGGIIALVSIILVVLDRGNALDNPHSVVGVIVMVLFGIQIALGIYIDKMWTPERESIPISDKLHWWIGRFVVMLALANIIYGIVMTGHRLYFWIPLAVILAAGIAAFAFGQYKLSHSTHSEKA